MYLHNQIGTVFRFNKDTATGGEPVAVKREDVPMVLGFCSSKEEGFGREIA
jgi:hypothetical protein